MWYQYLSVAFYGWGREEKESVEVDSALDKPSKPNWGLTHQLTACCHHCHELGRGQECPDQPVPKVTTKIVSVKYMVRLRCMDTLEYVVDEEREYAEIAIYRILPSKAGCRFI